jgi:hypothetical protein
MHCKTHLRWLCGAALLALTATQAEAQAVQLKVRPVSTRSGLSVQEKPVASLDQTTVRRIETVDTNNLPVRITEIDSGERLLVKEERDYRRSKTYKVTLSNLGASGTFTVQWHFLAREANGDDSHLLIYDEGEKAVPLKRGAFTSFDVTSQPLESADTMYRLDGREKLDIVKRKQVGRKPAGYVFVVKANDKILAVEASSRELKDNYFKVAAASREAKP